MPSKKTQPPKKTGRKLKPIDAQQVEKLAAIGATNQEIGDFFDCTGQTIINRFLKEIVKGRLNLKMRLRQAQLKVALGGNVAMLIWLGKQMLRQGEADMTLDYETDPRQRPVLVFSAEGFD